MSQYAEEETFNTELAADLEGSVIRLTFTGHSTHKPIVGELTLRYGLPFNILHGKMTQTAPRRIWATLGTRRGIG